ncbi:carbohydrate ABC transporter permease [Georgenia sp. Z1491]|uniref:carbohydrate ABC transporter permease n=1 Tax=Georgenia sp. Z1491 TaxID=3416707 RepID=UPI003CE8A752
MRREAPTGTPPPPGAAVPGTPAGPGDTPPPSGPPRGSGREGVPASARARRRRETAAAYALLAPSLVGLILFLGLPVLLVLGMSLTHYDLLGDPTWAGLTNYTDLAGDRQFRGALLVTAGYVLMAIPLTVGAGLLLAVLLNRHLPGSGILRVIYVLPWVCSPLALGVVWQWMLAPSNGAINAILGQRVEWMSDPTLALPAVALVSAWSSIGYVSLFFLAGLQQIPPSIYEAARLDGAGPFRMLTSMTIPLLRPTMFFVLVTTVISSFQVYDLVYGLTGGSPGYPSGSTDVIAARIYQEAFVALDLGSASAMAVVLFVVLVAITLVQQRYFASRTTYDMS